MSEWLSCDEAHVWPGPDRRPMYQVEPEPGEILPRDVVRHPELARALSRTQRESEEYVRNILLRKGKYMGKREAMSKLKRVMADRFHSEPTIRRVVVTSGGRAIGEAVAWSPDRFAYELDNGMWVDERDIIPVGTSGDTEYWQLMPNRETHTVPPTRSGKSNAFSDHNPSRSEPHPDSKFLFDGVDSSSETCPCGSERVRCGYRSTPHLTGTSDEQAVREAREARAGAQEARQRPEKGRPVSVRPPRAIEAGESR